MPTVPSSTPSTDNLPRGIDRADGLDGRLGTYTPPSAVTIRSSRGNGLIPIEETPDSPTMERAEQCTVRHRFTLDWQEGLNRWSIYPRGTLVEDSAGNYYRVLNCTIQHQKPDTAILDITSEALSFDNPPDEFQINPIKLGLDIMKHPRYFYALMPTNQIPGFTGTRDTDDQIQAKQTIIRAIQAYKENPVIPSQWNYINMSGALHDIITVGIASYKFAYSVRNPNFNPGVAATAPQPVGTTYASNFGLPYPTIALVNGDPNPQYYTSGIDATVLINDPGLRIAMAAAAAQEIIGKLWRMEDTPLENGVEIIHTEYWWRPPYLNLGGYLEDPQSATPPVPDYFLCPSAIPDGTTIFDKLSVFNPQCYATNGKYNGPVKIAWLRDADTIEFQRTFFKVTRRWLGAPIGSWDTDIYSQLNRPSVPSDYRALIL